MKKYKCLLLMVGLVILVFVLFVCGIVFVSESSIGIWD